MTSKPSSEEIRQLRQFKTDMVGMFWEKFGTFYIHVMPHPSLQIGKRGLVGEEQELGIILVLGPKAVKDYMTDDDNLYCELQFGYNWEKLIIPWDCIFRIYDKNQSAVTQMRFFNIEMDKAAGEIQEKTESNVIKVNFGAKKVEKD